MVIVLIIATLVGVSAIPSNWFEAADVTGTIVQSETGIIKAIINLGSLQSASDFSVTENGTIVVAEAEGLNITKFIITTPAGGQIDSYLPERFSFLTINLTIYNDVWSVPIVTDGQYQYGNWGSITGQLGYYYYTGWTEYYLPQGNHPIMFNVYGRTQIVSANLTVSITFLLELSA